MPNTSPLRVVIVDDEDHCVKTLEWELQVCSPACEIIGTFTDSIEASSKIRGLAPDILFLDIEMPKLNGFELLNVLGDLTDTGTKIIFTTAYSEYAVKAFNYSAAYYLLKPIDNEELQIAIKKATNTTHAPAESGSLKLLFSNLNAHAQGQPMRISLPSADGWELVEVNSIIRCMSDGSYTDVMLTSGRVITVSRNIKQLEESLPTDLFCRVHNRHLVNISHIIRFERHEGGRLIMSDESPVDVARARKEMVLNLLR